MIRKLSILFAGALMGATAMTAFVGPHSGVANAAGSDTYRQPVSYTHLTLPTNREV